MAKSKHDSVLGTDKRIRLGIWGLGRGTHFYRTCRELNFDVVAGCDFVEHMRDQFKEANPGALVTPDADEFLAADFDAVLLATYCPNHADDSIRCLEAGKHVLAEVTSFHTMAEGVRLVEAVEKSGLIYNLAENYPFSAANMYLARQWREGLFGELIYAEYEYVHEVRELCYTYLGGKPITPGDTVHNWRSWIDYHYYNTHSLGPVMVITGLRPTRVVALPGSQRIAGYPMEGTEGMPGIAPSLISLSNGSVMRNLMGATTSNTHIQRLWGTLGSSEVVDGELRLRLGASGNSPKFAVTPTWQELGELAVKTGHGGGDFWVLYYFARQILFGEPAPFDIYTAADCTSPGILAFRSAHENGAPQEVPDFRDKAQREKYRNDHFACPRYDVEHGLFPRGADKALVGNFTTLMKDVIRHALLYRAYADWVSVSEAVKEPAGIAEVADNLIKDLPEMRAAFKAAHKIMDAYPESDGARVLREMLALVDEKALARRTFLADARKQRDRLKRKAKKRS